MSPLETAVSAFTAADAAAITGLPAEATLEELATMLVVDPDDVARGQAGTPATGRSWVAAAAPAYGAGVRLWLDEDSGRVVLIEGLGPVGGDGGPLLAPDLGAPDAELEAMLGTVMVAGAERVYAGRGLALHVAPETGAVVRVLEFVPTSPDDYQQRLRPHHQPLRRFPGRTP